MIEWGKFRNFALRIRCLVLGDGCWRSPQKRGKSLHTQGSSMLITSEYVSDLEGLPPLLLHF